MLVQTGDNVAIGGFIITGTDPKRVLLRGIGPSLPVGGAMSDPILELQGPPGFTTITNDNWRDPCAVPCLNRCDLVASGIAPTNDLEAAICVTLDPGAYTAILRGKNNATGVGLVEVYDLDSGNSSQLANISTRGLVLTGSNVMIGGFILGGNGDTHVVVRGIGPSLVKAGITGFLADPTLELHDGNGALLVQNDNWQDDPTSASQLTALGLAPQNAAESGIYRSLPPGSFTAILAGKDGGTGIGLLEVYNVH